MFLNFKKTDDLIFLDKKRDIDVHPQKRYHIVLSPSLYWVKREKLPLKYLHEVKKIVATLFEEILPEGEYSYFVDKEDEAFLLFAYDDKAILQLLEEKGIRLGNVTGISFAQHSFTSEQEAVLVNEDEVIVSKEGLLVVLPSSWYASKKELQQSMLVPSSKKIHLEKFSHIVDRATLYKLTALIALLIIVLGAEYFYYTKELALLQSKRERLFKEYGLKPTLMQNRAILQEYRGALAVQKRLREILAAVLAAQLKKGERISSIRYRAKKLEIVFEGVTKAQLPRVLSKLYKQKIELHVEQRAKKLMVKVSL